MACAIGLLAALPLRLLGIWCCLDMKLHVLGSSQGMIGIKETSEQSDERP